MNQFSFDARDTVLVIGLGKSGRACVDVLRARGARVYATDEKSAEALGDALTFVSERGAHFVDPESVASITDTLTCAVLSPGVPLTSLPVRIVQDALVPVFGEVEVAYRLCRAPMIAVTGTKGKSTTTALIGHLLRACGKRVHVGGNIGNPLINEVLDAQPDEWVVAEVSSFQLETIRSFKPRVSVLLNIAPDHLDRYHSMDEYAEAKFRIFANQSEHDIFIGNLDDERIAALDIYRDEPRMHARQVWFTLRDRFENATMYVHGDTVTYAPMSGDPRPVALIGVGDVPLAGRHNVQNAMAASLAALAVGCELHDIRDALRSFRAMPHRLQPIGELDGVLYVDDSKSTNPGSVVAALHAYDRPVVLIAGGRPKGTDFAEMGDAVRARARAVVLIGEASDAIAQQAGVVPTLRAHSMQDAVERARASAQPGDVILLSPGCASFDMFDSAEDRGNRFVAAFHALEPAHA